MADLQLHDYQLVARDFLRQRDRAALFLDMGLGKTATSLTALEPRHLPALVVAPKRVAEHVWAQEALLWRPDLTVVVAQGSPAQRHAALTSGADVVVLGRDNLAQARDTTPPTPWRTLILDELSGFKSRASNRWKLANSIAHAPGMHHVWGLTGTPTPNGLMDLWSQVALLDGGARLGKNITAYRNRFFLPGRRLASGIVTEWVLAPGSDTKIYELVSDVCLSMATEGRITLPPVTHNHIAVTLPPKVLSLYRQLKRDLVVGLRDVLGGEVHSAANAAALTSRLSQVAAGFLYVDDADLRGGAHTLLHTAKADAVAEVVEGTGSPVLVFYRFKVELAQLRKALPQARTVDDPGVIADWNAGKVPVLLAHPASAGHGLNLQHGGHTVVWTSLTWSMEEWEQANKRVARQGQKHPVVIHTLMADHTIDPAMYARLVGKVDVQKALLDHLESPV